MTKGPKPLPLDVRFWPRVNKTETCWEWTGTRLPAKGRSPTGYGMFPNKKTGSYAHRYSYITMVGPIPEGMVLDHLCGNRCCVRPDHLEPVTVRMNVVRGMYNIKACRKGHPRYGIGTCKTCRDISEKARKKGICVSCGGETSRKQRLRCWNCELARRGSDVPSV